MAPAEATSIVVDEESHSMDVAVAEESRSQAIGRGGQNVRLASQLSGWDLNIMTESESEEKSERESEKLLRLFMEQLDVDENVASILLQEGFTSIEEVAYVPEAEMCKIEEFDQEIAGELQMRARDVLLTREIASAEGISGGEPAEDLLMLEGMDHELAHMLASKGIVTREDLAEQAVDELVEVSGIDAQRAGELIMQARAIWFETEVAESAEQG